MKVQKCNAATPPAAAAYPLSWHDILKSEGVYEVEDGVSVRVVVLATNSSSRPLWYNGETLTNCAGNWDHNKFRKIEGAVVCFEIKEPK